MTVLIITRTEDDRGPEDVAREVRKLGARAVRVDTDLFPTEVRLSVYQGSSSLQGRLVVPNEEPVDLADVQAIWFRRSAIGGGLPQDLGHQVRNACIGESEAVLRGLLDAIGCFVLDPPAVVDRAYNKVWQLHVAQQAGLSIPATVVTNRPAAVRALYDAVNGELVTKMMHNVKVYNDAGQETGALFTERVNQADLAGLDSLSLCPMTFQRAIPKAVEVRATVVGDRVLAAAVNSQALPTARDDWRREGTTLLDSWVPWELPAEVEQGLLAVADTLGLNYGAADLIVTPEGEHVFLEINPVGEFFWLDRLTKLPIARTLAEVLLDLRPRRDQRITAREEAA